MATGGPGPELQAALAQLVAAPTLLVASDFDGTLAPIVTNSWEAAAAPRAMASLAALAEAEGTHVALVTGRSVADLRALGPLPPKAYVIGSHGAEWSDGSSPSLSAQQARALQQAQAIAEDVVAAAPGVVLERKPAGFAVHVRPMADRALAALVLDRVAAALDPVDGLVLMSGKQVVEASVVRTSKGLAITRLRDELGADAVFFAGDDVTDEAGFAALGPGDVGVKVGAGPTAAGHCVADTPTLADVLRWLADHRA